MDLPTRLSVAAVCAASLTAAVPAASQTVAGRLLDEDTQAGVTGAFIVLIDSSGARVARGLTDELGGFSVRASTPGTYAVKVERIGYRSWTGAPRFLGVAETVREDIAVSAIPVQLDAVVVEADDDCRVRPAEGQAAAVLWEEARKALSAAKWAEREGWFQYVVARYERDLDASLRVVREELTRSDTVFTRSPFVSAPATDLAARGYVRAGADGSAQYFAPDADALLSDAFLDGHCFRVRGGDRHHRGMVGLTFEPARGRDLPDVAGVLWLDSATAELRTLEFDYTNFRLAGFDADEAAGLVEFRRVPSGHWVVREWWIRMPMLTVTEDRRRGERRPTVTGFRVAGGRVSALLTERGARRFEMAAGEVTGTVSMGGADRRLAGVEVSLVGTAYSATTDDSGRFRIAEVSPGRYTARATHPAFFVRGGAGVGVEVREGAVSAVHLVAPSAGEINARCDVRGAAAGSAVLVGVVRDAASGAPVPAATVEATRGEMLDTAVRALSIASDTDGRGVYVLCGIPHGVALIVRARAGRRTGEPVGVELDDAEVRGLDLRVAR